jgi:hypothetical protein
MGLRWKALQLQGTPLAEGVGDEEAAVDTVPLGEGSEEADSDSDPDAVKANSPWAHTTVRSWQPDLIPNSIGGNLE